MPPPSAASGTLPTWRWSGPLAAATRALSFLGTVPKSGADIADPEVRRTFPSMSQLPVVALNSLLDLMPRVRADLPEIRVPSLILHGDRDRTAPPACARTLLREIGTIDKRLVRLPRSGHVITVDRDRDQVAREIAGFLEQKV